MARPSNIPKYRKHSSGKARVTINGRDYLLGPWNSKISIREYDRIVSEYLASDRSPTFGIEQDAYTVAMLIRDYLRHCKSYYGVAATSELHRVKPALKLLRDLYADHDAAEIGPVEYKAVRQSMIPLGWSRPYVNTCMKKLRRAFGWAVSEGKIPASVFHTMQLIPSLKAGRTLAPETEPVMPVDDTIVEVTITYLPPIVADMVRLQRLLGCRPGEVCNVTPASLDRTGDVWVATLTEHKTKHHGHTRKLYAGPKAQSIITPYLDRDEQEYLFQPREVVAMQRRAASEARTTPLSCGNRPGRRSGGYRRGVGKKAPGSVYDTNSYRRAIHNACDVAFPAPEPIGKRECESKTAWLKRLTEGQLAEQKKWQSDHRWSPNRLRHSRGTEIRKAFGLEEAQVTLGHRNADVTQIYAERDEELAKHVARESG